MTLTMGKRVARDRRREGGSALLVSVMVLVLMGIMGLAALDTATRDRQTSGLQSRARAAFYAADAGFATALNLVRQADDRTDTPPLPTTSLGDPATYAVYGGRPTFRGDPEWPTPIEFKYDAAPPDGMSISANPTFVDTIWLIRTEGATPGGEIARIDAAAKKLLANEAAYQ